MMLEEIYRFDNIQVRKNGHDCGNTEQLWQSILEGLRACKAVNKVPETMGIDTWACLLYTSFNEDDAVREDTI